MNQKKILVFEIILCIFVQVSMYLIFHFIYADAFRIKFIIILLTHLIVITIFNWKREINTDYPKLRWFTLLLVSITIVVFIAYKPSFSYTKGKDIIAAQGYDNIYNLIGELIIKYNEELMAIKTYFQIMTKPGKGLDYCGVTLIPPESLAQFKDIIIKANNHYQSLELKMLIEKVSDAISKNKWLIHYGI